MKKFLLSIAFLLTCIQSFASPEIWYTKDNNQLILNVDFFMSTTCPHCQKADAFLTALEHKTNWIHVERHKINENKDSLLMLGQWTKAMGDTNFNVPSIFFCDSQWIGFKNENETGAEIIRGLNYCYDRLLKQGDLAPKTISVLRTWANANFMETRLGSINSPMAFTLQMALIDAVSPCGLFVLFIIISILLSNVYLKKGQVFKLISLLFVAHYFTQLHSEINIEIRPFLRLLGLVSLILYLGLKYKNKDPKKNMPMAVLTYSPWFASMALLLTFMVQQTCYNNMSMVYQQWLMHQSFDIYTYWRYVLLFQLFYLIPLLLFIFVLEIFKKTPIFKKYQSQVQLCSALIPVLCVIMLVVYPEGLTSILLALSTLLGAFLILRLRVFRYD